MIREFVRIRINGTKDIESFSYQIDDRILAQSKEKKKKEKRAGYKYIKVLVPPRFQDFRSRRENGGVITVNERIKGDELEEGKREKSEKQREKHESRNDTRTHRGRKEEEEEGEARRERGEKRKESAKRKSKRERERGKLCFDAIIIRGLFPATVHSTFVSDVEHPYRPRTGDHTQWALSYLPLKLGARSHAN